MTKLVRFNVNGKAQSVTTDPRRTLLDVLREDLGFTGTKFGCGEGQCRACTVLLDGKATPACQTTLDEAEGHNVETIESLAPAGALHPIQAAFIAEGAMQCGYCVPGILISAAALLKRNPSPTEMEVREALDRNLCRCGSQNRMVQAVLRAASEMAAP